MYLKQSEHEYFGRPLNFISPSDMKGCMTPAEFYYKKFVESQEQKDAKETKATILGTAIHALLLEKHKMEDCFWIFKKPYPDKSMNLTANKEAKAAQEMINAGKKCIDEKDWENLQKLAANVHKFISPELIESEFAIIEHSFYAKIIFDRDGVFQKVEDITDFAELEADKKNPDYIIMPICTKPDVLRPDHGIDIDVKSCVSAYPDKFAKDALSLGYPIQVAMGLDITSAVMKTDIDTFLFLALEKEPPYLGALFDASDFIEYGRSLYRKRLLRIYYYAKKNYWPGYSIWSQTDIDDDTEINKPINLYLPHYAIPVEQIKF
jgi:hypothetical protein